MPEPRHTIPPLSAEALAVVPEIVTWLETVSRTHKHKSTQTGLGVACSELNNQAAMQRLDSFRLPRNGREALKDLTALAAGRTPDGTPLDSWPNDVSRQDAEMISGMVQGKICVYLSEPALDLLAGVLTDVDAAFLHEIRTDLWKAAGRLGSADDDSRDGHAEDVDRHVNEMLDALKPLTDKADATEGK